MRVRNSSTRTKIYSAAISAEVAKNRALKMGTMAMLETSTSSDERKLFQMMLKDHVEGKLLGKKISKLRGAPAMKTRPAKYAIVPASDELMKNALDLKTSQTGKASRRPRKVSSRSRPTRTMPWSAGRSRMHSTRSTK